MKNTIKKWFVFWITFLFTVWLWIVWYWAWSNLPTVNPEDTLTETIWNNVINKVNDIWARTDWIYNSNWKIWIWTSNPTENLHVNWTIESYYDTALWFKNQFMLKRLKSWVFDGTAMSIDVWQWIWLTNIVAWSKRNYSSKNYEYLWTRWTSRIYAGDWTIQLLVWSWTTWVENSPVTWNQVFYWWQNNTVAIWYNNDIVLSNGYVWIWPKNSQTFLDVNWDIMSNWSNTWYFHTPDDGRTSLYFWRWSNGTIAHYPVEFRGDWQIAAVNVAISSDIRLKKDIKEIDSWLSLVEKLRWVNYYWKDELKEKNKQYWFIAQEVEEVLPDLVKTNSNWYKSINYDWVIPILLKAIQEQQDQIDELKLKLENK